MPVDEKTVHHIATLAHIGVDEAQLPALTKELNAILGFIEQLNELDTQGVRPMTGAVETQMVGRDDKVNDGGYPQDILANAPERDDDYFAVPKVVE